MKENLIILSIIFFLPLILIAQEIELTSLGHNTIDPVFYFNQNDSVIVNSSPDTEELYWNYILKPKNTLYRLSKMTGVSVADILHTNDHLNKQTLGIGDQIKIPLNPALLVKSTNIDSNRVLPFYFQVKKGQTLYTIAKKKLHISVLHLLKLNNLQTNHLSPDQLLFIGYLQLSDYQVPKKLAINIDSTTSDTMAIAVTNPLLSKFESTYIDQKIKYQKGIAYWRKSNSNGLFVLHRTARIGSVMELTNPMFGITLYAKVVGRLPKKAYTNDVLVVISPKIAKKLGALDPRFYIKLRYVE